jgi:DNA (cytosine-5)-methyltransferase 1
MLTFGSLFAGIGGFDLGLERAGMTCAWQVEIDEYASKVLTKHWPDVPRWGDVRTFPPGAESDWQVDLICAGVPCQPVSHAGKQKGAGDERWMWGEALRVVAHLKPRLFVAENPIGILSHEGGRTFRGLLRALASVGFVCEWDVIAAADLGAPHKRDRVWLVAYSDRFSRSTREPRRTGVGIFETSAGPQRRENQGQAGSIVGRSCEDELAASSGVDQVPVLPGLPLHDPRCTRPRLQLPTDRGVGAQPVRASDNLADSNGERPQGALLEYTGEGLPRSRGRAGRDEKQNLPETARGWWASEPDVGRVAHGVPCRVDRLRCLGNAVVPQIVELIGRRIIEHAARQDAG